MKNPTVIRDVCGTRIGYQRHHYHKEIYCQPCRDANTIRFREWYEKNKENERKRNQKNRQNPEYKEQRQVSGRKRRASKKDTEFDEYTYQDILHIYGIECHICHESIDLTAPRRVGDEGWELGLHLDHVVSLKRGGTDTLDNVKPSHAICNIKKSATV